ncbi:hypothetical protein HPB50_002697 [Hyalomma asiaticum]|uniref:Uncharacterized protein n=1 Tax=Hyalomma asiaticum TaxID=266040 RepID=A0ACB7TDR9_HYAAI|nr:hypothetical protein HPB50_002697 [Hyalomma asiaticum]
MKSWLCGQVAEVAKANTPNACRALATANSVEGNRRQATPVHAYAERCKKLLKQPLPMRLSASAAPSRSAEADVSPELRLTAANGPAARRSYHSAKGHHRRNTARPTTKACVTRLNGLQPQYLRSAQWGPSHAKPLGFIVSWNASAMHDYF